jgi:hypothetical protein
MALGDLARGQPFEGILARVLAEKVGAVDSIVASISGRRHVDKGAFDQFSFMWMPSVADCILLLLLLLRVK